jgi:hypothetical protein
MQSSLGRRQHDTWITTQLRALETRIAMSERAAEALQPQVRWYKELEQALLDRAGPAYRPPATAMTTRSSKVRSSSG